MTADFGGKTLNGSMATRDTTPQPAGTLTGNWAAGVNQLNGTISTNSNGSGVFRGMFFGTGANAAKEIGGVWNLNNNGTTSAGVMAAKRQ